MNILAAMHANPVAISIILAALLMAEKSIGAGDTLSQRESLTGNQTLTSKSGTFEMGFFPTSTNRFYLSIRYTQIPKPLVWIANRENPLPDPTTCKLQISSNGDLQVYNGSDIFWSTSSSSSTSPESVVAVLLDDGNLILRDERQGIIMTWQSFHHPTDTWLPGATLSIGQRLVSWTSNEDPSPGMFSAEISPESTIVFKWRGSAVYWESGSLEYADQWGLDDWLVFQPNEKLGNSWRLDNAPSFPTPVFSMLVMSVEGRLRRLTSWGTSLPNEYTFLPGKLFCGAYGIVSSSRCECVRGFSPSSSSPIPGAPSCDRNTPLDCGDREGFMEISDIIKWPNQKLRPRDGADSDNKCELACLYNCNCTAYAFDLGKCFVWERDLFGMERGASGGRKLHLKLASSDLPKQPSQRNKTLEVMIAVVVPVVVVLATAAFFYNRRTKHNKVNKEAGEDLLSFDFNSTNDGTILRTTSNMEIDLPMFSYSSVSAATNNFSPQNKLGEGGFGPVYKGGLQNGQEIAIKRLSQKSGQGFEEFRNEILLIAKLQHRNLVRLLGCCIDPVESILIYEYMPNKSLDLFLFGSKKQEMLDWKTRTRIVEGVAQGLLYLHEYSRVRIIHRDLKASNILLDDEMSPKISDFGMARIFGGADSRGYTNRVVGTFGYIAPEYALEGLFSTKSDVYSFGVLILEIISGRKNTGFYKTDSLHLLGHAWNLWISGRGVELVDAKVGSPAASTALRYINVGLLCVKENPNDRPNMSSVVSMLSSEIAALPPPNKPAFSTTDLLSKYSSHPKSDEDPSSSGNHLTVSTIVPR